MKQLNMMPNNNYIMNILVSNNPLTFFDVLYNCMHAHLRYEVYEV